MSTLLMSTSPVPLGVIAMLPLLSVEVIALPLILILSTSRSVFIITVPVPLGDKFMLPFESVLLIVLPSMVILSMSTCVSITIVPSDLIRIRSVAAADVFVLNTRAVALLSEAKVASATASIAAPSNIASVPLDSSGALNVILPITSVASIESWLVCRFNSKPLAAFAFSPVLCSCVTVISLSAPKDKIAESLSSFKSLLMFTEVDASISTIGAVISNSASASMSSCPLVLELINSPLSRNCTLVVLGTSITPVPSGSIVISPLESVLDIVLPSNFKLSTRRSVTALFVPIVTASIAPPFMSTVA